MSPPQGDEYLYAVTSDSINDEDLLDGWQNLERDGFEDTAIPAKYRERIGLVVAANIECHCCQHFHRKAAKMHGAAEELGEVAFPSSGTARYSALVHGMDYGHDTFGDEFGRIAEHLEETTSAGD